MVNRLQLQLAQPIGVPGLSCRFSISRRPEVLFVVASAAD
jgi:hypothetical protein